MKRNLDKNKHQMTEWEKENLWLAIEGEAGAKAGSNGRFGLGWLRFTGGATVLAAMILTVFIWTDSHKDLIGPEKVSPDGGLAQKTVIMGTPNKEETITIMPPKPKGTLGGEQSIMMEEQPTPEVQVTEEKPTIVEEQTIAEEPVVAYGKEIEERLLKAIDTGSEVAEQEISALPAPAPTEIKPTSKLDKGKGNYEIDAASIEPLHVRGGRSTEISMQMDSEIANEGQISKPSPQTWGSVRPHPARVTFPGSVTGGETPPNGEKFELMYFEHTGVNPFLPTEEDSLSTFAVDVDNASWTLTRSYLNRGSLPPKDAIRVEEFVNAFTTGFPQYRRPKNSDDAFAIHVDGMNSPFGKGYQLMRVGLVGETVEPENRKPASLIFVIDTSGSMRQENRLETVKDALKILLNELQEGDTVGIVTYGSRGEIALQPTDISRRSTIIAAIERLQCGGSTNAEEGLQLAYRMAREHYQENVINRLILCTDGVANVGGTDADRVLDFVRTKADQGIALSAIGFGMGNYNDVFMEKLANKGDGNYYYVDSLKEAKRVFKENLTGTLQTIAREVKIQVAFDPETVERWRLLGYENRDVADNDFRNDKVDAGEIGAGHQVTALYEIKLKDGLRGKSLGTIRVRQEGPAHDARRAGIVTESSLSFNAFDVAGDSDTAELHLQVQILVAEFAEILRGSYWARDNDLQDLVPLADELARKLGHEEQVKDLARLIRKAASLAAKKHNR